MERQHGLGIGTKHAVPLLQANQFGKAASPPPAIVHRPAGLKTTPGSLVHSPADLADTLPTLAELVAHIARILAGPRTDTLGGHFGRPDSCGPGDRVAAADSSAVQRADRLCAGDACPLEQILDLADKASDRSPPNLTALIRGAGPSASDSPLLGRDRLPDSPGRRRVREDEAVGATERQPGRRAAHRRRGSHRVPRRTGVGLKSIEAVLNSGNLHQTLAAQNTLDFVLQAGRVTLGRAQELVGRQELGEPADRIPRHLLELPGNLRTALMHASARSFNPLPEGGR